MNEQGEYYDDEAIRKAILLSREVTQLQELFSLKD
jgi:hypothetical protein